MSEKTTTILILAANPKGTVPLRLEEEIREIREGLKRSQYRDRFVVEYVSASRPRDVQRAILDYKPQVVHFCGHGEGEQGLVLEDEMGAAKLVSTEALATLFDLFADQVDCVLLNACYSAVQAEAIAGHIAQVIGMSQPIGDRAAVEFAVGFYDALGAGKSVDFAFRAGLTLMQMQGIAQQHIPRLFKKSPNAAGSADPAQPVSNPDLNQKVTLVESGKSTPLINKLHVVSGSNDGMTRSITWLHLSDLHACRPKTGWDARRVIDALCKDLQNMQDKQGLRPDLIFFTGDAAYGHLGETGGKSIHEQFGEAHNFLKAVREAFTPHVDQRNLFLVPGNHDVNRTKVSSSGKDDLRETLDKDTSTTIIQNSQCIEWQRFIARLEDYENFLQRFGYDHLLTQRERLIYADAREVAGVRIGIAGFNSAWSAFGGAEDKGKLWMASRFQLETLVQEMPSHDFKIALLHHPTNWLVAEENPNFDRQLERDFAFVLHGHEHQDFVKTDAHTGHSVISAGACHEWSESKNNGYNFVRLDLDTGEGQVWLRQYDATGGGWVPRCIARRTDDRGCWPLSAASLEPWLGKLRDVQKKDSTDSQSQPSISLSSPQPDSVEPARKLASVELVAPSPKGRRRIFISYKKGAKPDEMLAKTLYLGLSSAHQVFISAGKIVGTSWAKLTVTEIQETDFLIALLSADSVHSEMVVGEIETAHNHEKTQGKPMILPIRVAYREAFKYPLSAYLDAMYWAFWDGEADTAGLIEELRLVIAGQSFNKAPYQPVSPAPAPLPLPSPAASPELEMPGGTMDPESQFYIVRDQADEIALGAIQRQGVTITIKGPRQMGKSSLLSRTMVAAGAAGKQVAYLDFQLFDQEILGSAESFYRQFCTSLTEQLDIPDRVAEFWQEGGGNIQRCTLYMEKHILKSVGRSLLLAMDEVDRMFDVDYSSDFFGMLRAWHNKRSLPMVSIWKRFDLALVTATEPYHLIVNLNQSPFNVGEVIVLLDFTAEEVSDLNQRYGAPLTPAQEKKLMDLLKGHPYLVRRGLYLIASQRLSVEALFDQATSDEGPFGDHLRYHLFRIYDKQDLVQGLLQVIRANICPDERIARLLVAAGLVRRDSKQIIPRCQLYADFFQERLNG